MPNEKTDTCLAQFADRELEFATELALAGVSGDVAQRLRAYTPKSLQQNVYQAWRDTLIQATITYGPANPVEARVTP